MSEETRTEQELKMEIIAQLFVRGKKRVFNVTPDLFEPPISRNDIIRIAFDMERDGDLQGKPNATPSGCLLRLSGNKIAEIEASEED